MFVIHLVLHPALHVVLHVLLHALLLLDVRKGHTQSACEGKRRGMNALISAIT